MKIIPHQYLGGTGYEVQFTPVEMTLFLAAVGGRHPSDSARLVEELLNGPHAAKGLEK